MASYYADKDKTDCMTTENTTPDAAEAHGQTAAKPDDQKPQAEKKNAQSRSKNRVANQAAVTLMCETYPKAFDRENVRPLKIGIQEDILADEKVSKTKAKRALASYVRSPQYHKSLVAGAARVDLNGEPAGTVTEQEADHAQTMLKQMRERRNERIKQQRAEQKPPGRKAGAKKPADKKRAEHKRTERKPADDKKAPARQPQKRNENREERFNNKLNQLLNKHQGH